MPTGIPARVVWLLLAGVLSFSFSPILIRYAGEVPGVAVASLRTAFAALLLAPFVRGTVWSEMRRLAGRDWGLIGGAGVLLGLHFILFIESLYYTSVASASVLVALSPLFLAVMGYIWLRERLGVQVYLAMAVALAGAVLIGVGDLTALEVGGARSMLGNLLATSAAFLMSLYLLVGRIVRQRISWLAYVFPLYTVVAVTTCLTTVVRQVPLVGYPAYVYGLCFLMALGPQIVGHGSFNYAVRYIPVTMLGLIALTEPIGASLLAYVLFGERPPPASIVGIAVTLVGVAVAIWLSGRRRSAPRAASSVEAGS